MTDTGTPPNAVTQQTVLMPLDVRRIPLLIIFFYAATPYETPGMAAGNALLIKVAFLSIFVVGLLSIRPYVVSRKVLLLATGLASYFLLVNVQGITNYVPLQMLLIFEGVFLADFAHGSIKRELLFVITGYLVIHLVGVIIAYGWFTATRDLFDFHNFLIPFSKSRITMQLGLARVTGFQIEPGTYAAWAFIAVFARAMILRRINSLLHHVCILSTLLTFSAYAFVVVAFFYAAVGMEILVSAVAGDAVVLQRLLKRIAIGATGGIFLTFTALYSVASNVVVAYTQFVLMRFSRSPDTAGGTWIVMLQALEAFRSSLSSIIFLGRPIGEKFCPWCASYGDMPITIFIFYYFGIIPTVLFSVVMGFLITRKFGLPYTILYILLLLSRENYYDPFFCMILGLAVVADARIPKRAATEAEVVGSAPQFLNR